MFMGEFHHNIDAKGRLIIPVKFRNQLGDMFVLTRGMDGCLFGYPVEQWKILEKQMQKLPLTKHNARSFVRFFYSAAAESEFDKQGRINISEALIHYADLKKECVIAGVSDRIEIWNAEKWEQDSEETAKNFDKISEDMIDLDI